MREFILKLSAILLLLYQSRVFCAQLPELRWIGLIASSRSENHVSVLKYKNQIYYLKVGQELPNKWKIEKLQGRNLLLRKNDDTIMLKLGERDQGSLEFNHFVNPALKGLMIHMNHPQFWKFNHQGVVWDREMPIPSDIAFEQ